MTASKRRAEEYEFNSPEVNACPYAFYEAARAECPVYPLPGQSAFLLTRFADVYDAAHHPETFSSHRPIRRYRPSSPTTPRSTAGTASS